MVLIYFSGRKECGREIRLVRRIGKMLHLYCNPFLRPVRTSRAIQRRIGYTIGGIYLCSRLITPHYQDSAAAFVSEFNKIFLKFSRLPVIEDPALTVSSANIQRREIRIYVTPDFFGTRKSIGVPSTSSISPVGICVASIGSHLPALIFKIWSRTVPESAPRRFQ